MHECAFLRERRTYNYAQAVFKTPSTGVRDARVISNILYVKKKLIYKQ